MDLNPAGYLYSNALSASGEFQVGYGSLNGDRALLWSGTAANAVDLNPVAFTWTKSTGVSGTTQVGFGKLTFDGSICALLWSGTATSVVDLHPADFGESRAFSVSGANQWAGVIALPEITLYCGAAPPPVSWT